MSRRSAAAALAGELASVEQLLCRRRRERRNEIGMTALMYAAEAGRDEVVDLLLSRGAFVDAQTSSGVRR